MRSGTFWREGVCHSGSSPRERTGWLRVSMGRVGALPAALCVWAGAATAAEGALPSGTQGQAQFLRSALPSEGNSGLKRSPEAAHSPVSPVSNPCIAEGPRNATHIHPPDVWQQVRSCDPLGHVHIDVSAPAARLALTESLSIIAAKRGTGLVFLGMLHSLCGFLPGDMESTILGQPAHRSLE